MSRRTVRAAVVWTVLGCAGLASGAQLKYAQMWATKPVACAQAIANVPAPVTTFQSTDPQAYLWFYVEGILAGDVVASEYYTPSGDYYAPASGPWLAVDESGDYCFTDVPMPIAGAAPATLPGVWKVRGSLNGQTLFELTFTIVAAGGGPQPAISGLVSAADYSAGLAPGAMMAIFGSELAAELSVGSTMPLPTELNGVRVEVIDGGVSRWAALFFISPGQINAQMPFGITGSTVQVRVMRGASASAAVTVAMAARAPRLFTRDMSGVGETILVHAADWTLVTADSPAVPGEYVILYLTGLGEVTPAAQTGAPGGDNATWGPLNYCSYSVTVTVEGKPGTVVFAGLAPGFVGLYQVNWQVPAGLAEGPHPVVVTSGTAQSQANVYLFVGRAAELTPADVVKSALESQVRGDVDGLLNYYARDQFLEENWETGRKVAETVAAHVTFSDFEFTELATAMGDQGTMAAVRAVVTFTVRNHEGQFPMKNGVMALLKRVNGEWKLIEIDADAYLNQEFYEDSLEPGLRRAARAAEPLDLRTINQAVTEAMKRSTINEYKLGFGGAAAIIGMIPVIGDGIANAYQIIDTLNNTYDLLQELRQYGFGELAPLKAQQVAIGIMQIVTEVIPGLDTFTDTVSLSLDQLVHNLERARALGTFRAMVASQIFVDAQLNPRLYLWNVPKSDPRLGLQWVEDPGVETSYDKPPLSVFLVSNVALGKLIPFRVVGELSTRVDSLIAEPFQALGASTRGLNYYLPVDASLLLRDYVPTGARILDNFGGDVSGGPLVFGQVTCRRGKQEFAVSLRNGETTKPVQIFSEVMNGVTQFQIDGTNGEPVRVGVNQTLGGVRVFGKPAEGSDPLKMVDLTNRPECLSMSVVDPKVVRLERGETISFTGLKEGNTRWQLDLPGDQAGLASAVTREVQVVVGGVDPGLEGLQRMDGIYMEMALDGQLDTGGETITHFGFAVAASPPQGLHWEGNRFHATGVSPYLGFAQEYDLEGTVNASTHVLESARMQATQRNEDGVIWIKFDVELKNVAPHLDLPDWIEYFRRKGEGANPVTQVSACRMTNLDFAHPTYECVNGISDGAGVSLLMKLQDLVPDPVVAGPVPRRPSRGKTAEAVGR